MKLSIVIPVYNEEENVTDLFEEIQKALAPLDYFYEVLFVDDGSRDKSAQVIRSLGQKFPGIVRGVLLRRNFGQTAAMAAGLEQATGDVLLFMDADGQNDPKDIPRLIEKINQGYDVVCGWRKERQDKAFSRKVPSKIANWLIRKIGGVEIHDLGCSLKAFRMEIIREVKLYGEMHRFIPLYASAVGAKITEMVVHHRPRMKGVSKYGIMRTFKVILDLVTVKFLIKYSARPMHFFGGVGFYLILMSFLSGLAMVVQKYVNGTSMVRSPLLLLSATLLSLGINFILMGILAEVQARIYYETQDKTNYRVRDLV